MSQTKAELIKGLNINASAPATALNIDSSGRVGIGTTSPSTTLAVAGGISGTAGINVSGSGWGVLPYVANSLVIDSTAGQTRLFATGTDASTHGNLLFFTGTTNGTASERARIDSSGRLLVGTSSTSVNFTTALLQGNAISSTTEAALRLCRGNSSPTSGDALGNIIFADSNHGDAAFIFCARDGGTWNTSTSRPTRLVFSTCGDGASTPTERMRIANKGLTSVFGDSDDVFVSRTSQVAGTSRSIFTGFHTATNNTNGTACYTVTTNGNVLNTNGSYTTLSDAKLKENIVDAGSQWDDLKAIQIRNWNFKAETGHETHRQIGPIAQELEAVCPGLVFETPDRGADGNETGEVTKGVNQSVLYMKAVKALQEAMERIEQLEIEMAAIKAQLA